MHTWPGDLIYLDLPGSSVADLPSMWHTVAHKALTRKCTASRPEGHVCQEPFEMAGDCNGRVLGFLAKDPLAVGYD